MAKKTVNAGIGKSSLNFVPSELVTEINDLKEKLSLVQIAIARKDVLVGQGEMVEAATQVLRVHELWNRFASGWIETARKIDKLGPTKAQLKTLDRYYENESLWHDYDRLFYARRETF